MNRNTLLVVDDVEVNRALLRALFENNYNILLHLFQQISFVLSIHKTAKSKTLPGRRTEKRFLLM